MGTRRASLCRLLGADDSVISVGGLVTRAGTAADVTHHTTNQPTNQQHKEHHMNIQPRTVTTRRVRRATAFGLTVAAVIAGTAIVASAHQRPDPSGGLTAAQRKVILEATVTYRDPAAAIAAGYVPTDVCVELPGVGGMGYHYVHPERAGDTNIDPTMPEVLVYAPGRNGRPRLAAIEYFQADADGDVATDQDRPTLFGEPFEGPMEGHEPGMPVHYDLHAWVWKHNPAGELAAWNPAVDCP